MFYYGEGNGLLRYRMQPGEEFDEFTWSILRQNPPAGVLVPGRETLENAEDLLFPVGNGVPMKDSVILKKEPNKYKYLLKTILTNYNSLSQYMIPKEEVILRPEFTFLDPVTAEPKLLVLPVRGAEALSLDWEDYAALVASYFPEEQKTVREEGKQSRESPMMEGDTLFEKLRLYWRKLGEETEN